MPSVRTARIRNVALLLVAAASLPLAGGFVGNLHPAFDSLAHFRVHLAVLVCLFALPLLAGRHRLHGLLAIMFGLAGIGSVSGLPGLGSVHASLHPRQAESAVYRLLQINLRFDNASPGKVLSLIGRVQPDVITLQEVSEMWEGKLALLAAAYPYKVNCRQQGIGVAILSRRPMLPGADCTLYGSFARALVDFGGMHVEVASLHLAWPWPFAQEREIDSLVPVLGRLSRTALLAGDLNATPWSSASRRVAEAGQLVRVGPVGPTWLHRQLPELLRPVGLPIDHVFAKGDVLVHSARSLEAAGSDHLPILVEFSLERSAPADGTATVRLAERSAAPRA